MRHGWRSIAEEGRQRIFRRDWAPGATIPPEARLAAEFGASRGTVNRALRALAEEGWVERRRRLGTRVALHPVGRATFAVPLIRAEVEGAGRAYGYRLIERREAEAPEAVRRRLGAGAASGLLRVRGLHLADGAPYAHEDRWINLGAVPEARGEGFAQVSANEWLSARVPFTAMEVHVAAEPAGAAEAEALGCGPGAPLLVVERTTRGPVGGITLVRIAHGPGHRMRSLP